MPKFKAGQIANPNGRPKNSGYKQKLYLSLVIPTAEDLISKGLEMALNGDSKMMSLFLDRLLPKSFDDYCELGIPSNPGLKDVKNIGNAILAQVSQGEISLTQCQGWFDALRSYRETALIEELLSIANELTKKKKQIPNLSSPDVDNQPQE